MQTVEIDIEKINRMNFRNCLEALSRPGTIYQLEPLFNSGILAMASVLLYSEVSYHYHGNLDFQMIAAITGAKAEKAERADYLFCDSVDLSFLEKAKLGPADNPEDSAVVFFQCDNLDAGTSVRFSGPGVDGTSAGILPISSDLIIFFTEKNSEYPIGLDLFFVDSKNRILGLPRTVNIEVIS